MTRDRWTALPLAVAVGVPVLLLIALTGCASQPPQVSPFERCVSALGGTAGTGWYVNERLRVADWCDSHGHTR